ncbi:MAG: DUF547 domain-containing protein [Chitinivibrionales bacterium]|nr:DUF547 domain-containing protein [Chitinivibrionales bacterium]MBD3356103.1 DUF547 domain-containing protein [Chitinivibrionales bacterium]
MKWSLANTPLRLRMRPVFPPVRRNRMKAITRGLIILPLLTAAASSPRYPLYEQLLSRHVCEQGVDYKALKGSRMLAKAVKEMKSIGYQYDEMNKNGKIAYLINLYNLYTLKLIADNYPLQSIRDLEKPWDRNFVPFDGREVSLDYIEHTILRKGFDEPRIHFAVNCASIDCPDLRPEPYTGPQLHTQLDDQAVRFLSDTNRNRRENDILFASKLFKWYGNDFNSRYGGFKAYIKNVLDIAGPVRIKYLDYDWGLNEAQCP